MIYLIVGLISIAIWITVFIYFDDLLDSKIISIILGFLAGIAAASLISMLIINPIAELTFEIDLVLEDKIELHSLQDNITASGKFFLGSGKYEENPEYFFMVKEGERLKLDSRTAENSYIVESDTQPRMEYYRAQYKNDRVSFWFIEPMNVFDVYDEYVFYVPEGSVIHDFNIDLQ